MHVKQLLSFSAKLICCSTCYTAKRISHKKFSVNSFCAVNLKMVNEVS